ncbi:thiamine phosphate synthase [Gordonia sp. (in: high G+C Gram-positive bacteria)]|mgnify:CR=1 FL=1|uniref:thiamine phosphate synthase n=1 Tax=Gordonia sp. (in: high G+C Gram-positive bacteria) TaxID=84139 RepID=UPI00169C367A|nr:thiamine phosphate synthase [Gordonia sp. (in: high G+C Gram-positive bacteria)]NLG45590.1 thiamine phosphate synthase [Gordonia sp. (in: high G+C Gram-positive bacteria)]
MNARTRLDDAHLYLCTDARRERGDLVEFVRAALDGGVDIVQLRDKNSPGERELGELTTLQELEILAQLKELTAAAGTLLAVNDRADIAVAAQADVFHVGQDDLPPATARRIVGPDVVIGRSTHSIEQARAAMADADVDYFCTGPLWATPTKPGRAATGLDLLRATADEAPSKPWFAIGGVDLSRVPEVTAAGAHRIVVVRAVTGADDPAAAAAALKHACLSGAEG